MQGGSLRCETALLTSLGYGIYNEGEKTANCWEEAMTDEKRNAISTFGKLPCAQCGAKLIAPAWSEYFSAGRVRHFWSCDACKYEFEMTVVFKDDCRPTSDLAA